MGDNSDFAPVSFRTLKLIVDGLAKTTREYIADAFKSRDARLEAIEKRLAEIESGGIRYEGVWIDGKVYNRGTFVTRNGSCWHANVQTLSKPGDSTDWTLAVKSGRDGRDAR